MRDDDLFDKNISGEKSSIKGSVKKDLFGLKLDKTKTNDLNDVQQSFLDNVPNKIVDKSSENNLDNKVIDKKIKSDLNSITELNHSKKTKVDNSICFIMN